MKPQARLSSGTKSREGRTLDKKTSGLRWGLVLGSIVLAGGAASVVALTRPTERRAAARSAASTTPESRRPQPEAPPTEQPGVTYRYDVTFGIQAGAERNRSGAIRGQATLALHELRGRRGEFVGHFAAIDLSKPGVTNAEAALQRDALETMERSLAVPFYFRRDRSGRVDRFAYAPSPGSQILTVARTVAAVLQFQAPPTAEATDWVAEEPDVNGPCALSYKKLEPQKFLKTKQDCRFSLRGIENVGGVSSATVRLTHDGGSVPSSVELDESARMTLGETMTAGSFALTLRLKEEREEANPHPGYARWAAGPLHDVPVPKRVAQPDLAEARARVQGKTYSSVRTDLEKARDGDVPRVEALRDLSAFFLVSREALGEAVAEIRGGLARELAEPIMAAMAGSRSPEAEAELLRLAEDSGLGAELREDALVDLGAHEAPSELTLRKLADMATTETDASLRQQSLLALGGAARTAFRDESMVPVADEAVDEILEFARTSGDPAAQRAAVGALGNAGSARGLDVLEAALRSEDSSLRAGAALGLRFIPGERADELIVRTLIGDPDATVRASAASAIGYRELSAVLGTAALSCVQEEPVAAVRSALLGALLSRGARSADSPGFPALAWIARNDTDPKLRAQAEALLGKQAGL